MKTIKALKHRHIITTNDGSKSYLGTDETPYSAWLPKKSGVIFYMLKMIEDVDTTNYGIMKRVTMRSSPDLWSDPSFDVAADIGRLPIKTAGGLPDYNAPSLFYWNDKYWVQALNTNNVIWNFKKTFLLYEVKVVEPEGWRERLEEWRERQSK